MDWAKIVGANIRKTRLDRGLSQEDLAHKVQLDVSYLGQVERGVRNPTIRVLGRIADALETPLVRLLDMEGDGSP